MPSQLRQHLPLSNLRRRQEHKIDVALPDKLRGLRCDLRLIHAYRESFALTLCFMTFTFVTALTRG